MRGTTRLATLVAVVLGVAGCAHDVEARFPAAAGEATGVVELVFSTPASAVSVAVNGQLLGHDRRATLTLTPRNPLLRWLPLREQSWRTWWSPPV